jgi:hypothetical protein
MLDSPRYSLVHRPTAHRRGYDNSFRLAIFPVRDANFFQIEHQFSHTRLDTFIQILECPVRNTGDTCKRCYSWGTLFVCIFSLGWRRIDRFTQSRGIRASNWLVEWALISVLLTGVRFSEYCWSQSSIDCSRSWSRAVCFPRCPGDSNLWARVDCTAFHGHANALASALIEVGILSGTQKGIAYDTFRTSSGQTRHIPRFLFCTIFCIMTESSSLKLHVSRPHLCWLKMFYV